MRFRSRIRRTATYQNQSEFRFIDLLVIIIRRIRFINLIDIDIVNSSLIMWRIQNKFNERAAFVNNINPHSKSI